MNYVILEVRKVTAGSVLSSKIEMLPWSCEIKLFAVAKVLHLTK